ncbi:hypothetical protein [Leifsonia sp. EB34]|uniref:hypothetical protein n=1 Tax=Leifsonia sp. EB34 TaxID=3156303 RepID=UPI003517AF30
MTSWPEQPAEASQPPQTRRQARESERTAARQAARRAGTSQSTPAGEIPETSSTPGAVADDAVATAQTPAEEQAPAIPASAFAEPGVSSGGSFDNLLFTAPKRPAADPSADASSFDLFRQAPDSSKPEPVTQPVSVLPGSSAAPVRATSPQSTAPASSTSDDESDAGGDRTLTRRELRAMLQAQAANQQANHSPAIAEPIIPVTFTDEGAPAAAAQRDETAVTSSPASVFTGFGSQAAAQAAPAAPASAAPAPAAAAAPAEADTSAQERRPFTPPTGHWSMAAELEDGSEPITSRNVGHSTAATTTNALILPSLPQADATGPLTSTGEILVTGSIDLPRTLGSTGAHDRIDSSDIDRLLDSEENEFNTSEVAPVRASRAISTHTSTRGVIAPPKKRGNALPVVLMVTAGVLAVSVIGLLIAAYVLHVF